MNEKDEIYDELAERYYAIIEKMVKDELCEN